MALASPALATLVNAKLVAKGLRADPQTVKTAEAIAEAFVEYFTANAQVAGIITACPAGAGSGTAPPGSIT